MPTAGATGGDAICEVAGVTSSWRSAHFTVDIVGPSLHEYTSLLSVRELIYVTHSTFKHVGKKVTSSPGPDTAFFVLCPGRNKS